MANMIITSKHRESIKKFVNQKFAQMDPFRVGLTNITQYSIHISRDAIPWRQESYEEDPVMMRLLYNKIASFVDKGYIRSNHHSEWSSSARMLKNKDGELVFHVDYTKLNESLTEYNYPVHNPWKILQKLRNARIISTIKIKEAFHQIEVEKESRKYTAFNIPGHGVFEWVRMPYGIKGGPSTYSFVADQIKKFVFERIRSLYRNIQGEDHIFVCLETWIVISETSEGHKVLLDCLLDELYENGLKIDVEKSQFAKERINYCGFTIDYNGLHVSKETTEQIMKFPSPKNILEVRQFNSMIHHYRNHVKDIAMIQGPLNKFCATNAIWKWTEDEEEAFRKIKQALSNPSSLSMLDPNLPFRLYTYLAYEGHGAELVQCNKRNNREILIRYVSKCFNETEKTYPSLDRQVLSIVSALSEVEDIINDRECEVITDRSVFLWYNSKKKASRRLNGWATVLSKYNITLKSYCDFDNEIPVVQMGYISICE